MDAQQQSYITKEQAIEDLNSLIHTISEVHPNMFSVCKQGAFFDHVGKEAMALPDSLTDYELYKRLAPIVAMIGDGHTGLKFPYNSYSTKETLRLPLLMRATTDYRLLVNSCIDDTIPSGSEVLSINGVTSKQIIEAMLPYAGGEKHFYRINGVNYDMPGLFEILFKADEYNVSYRSAEDESVKGLTLQAATYEQFKQRMPQRKQSAKSNNEPYSFTINEEKSYAVMDFLSFHDVDKMKAFADSMFTELRARNIKKLIIDVRYNGGGNSGVGDVLFRYISPCPFVQAEKMLVRYSAVTQRLLGNDESNVGWGLYIVTEEDMKHPLSDEEGHYNGDVILLTSHRTYSSAGMFSWAFKQFGMGTVIGEETGGMNVHYGDIVSYELPNSKLRCFIPHKRFWQYGADETDIHGTLPDISVPAADALQVAIDLIP